MATTAFVNASCSILKCNSHCFVSASCMIFNCKESWRCDEKMRKLLASCEFNDRPLGRWQLLINYFYHNRYCSRITVSLYLGIPSIQRVCVNTQLLYIAIIFYFYLSPEDVPSNSYESEGILLNTNTIDAFKDTDKKKLLESLSLRVSISLWWHAQNY